MVSNPKPNRRSPGRTLFAIVVGVIFVIGLITVFRWVGSLLSMGFFVLVVAAIVAIIVIARRS